MTSVVGALYLALRRVEPLAERVLGPVLLPLGRNSFYVFIMHVFLCLAVASVPVSRATASARPATRSCRSASSPGCG